MKPAAVAVLVFSAATVTAQPGLWSHVRTDRTPGGLAPATLSSGKLKAIGALIRHQRPDQRWDCEGADLDEMIEGLQFEKFPVPGKQEVVLAEAPAGCGRGGQGANGAMWLIRLDGPRPTFLATPDTFSGWIYAVLDSTSHGYPDIVTGWHMSADEADLAYLRFDGEKYRSISAATLVSDEDGNRKIVPNPPKR